MEQNYITLSEMDTTQNEMGAGGGKSCETQKETLKGKRLVKLKTPQNIPHHPLLPVLCTNAIHSLRRHKA